MKRYKVGILGGTFNPIHNGHLMIAENACEQFHLDKVLIMPTGHSPHKEYMGADMSEHRCKMAEAAIRDNDHFELSYMEIQSETVNYTYQTLARLNAEHPDTQYYFILGADSLFDFDIWRCPELICKEAIILAAIRDRWDEAQVDQQIDYLTERYKGEFHRLYTPNLEISSNELRARVHAGKTIRYMVPDSVADYIRNHQLYK